MPQSPFTIVIPALNEAEGLRGCLPELIALPDCREVIVVDDGSTDATASLAEELGARIVRHPYNRGYGAALKTGIRACIGEWVVICDGDGQHRMEDVAKVAALRERYDMVVGMRSSGSRGSWIRAPGKWVLGQVANLLAERPIPDLNSGLRCFRLSLIRKCLHLMPDGFSFSTTSTLAIFSKGGSVHYEPILTENRVGRHSTVSIWRDGWNVIKLIVRLTVLFNPMKVFLPMAILFSGSSLVYFAAYSAMHRLHVTSSMVLLFVTGALLFFMGILSEQVSALRRDLKEEA